MIEDVVYLGMKNDLSILVSDNVTLYCVMGIYEQQSSFNPNMPIRGLMYAGKLYDKFLYTSRLNRFGKKLVPLPVPKLVVFYNGTDEKDDDVLLELSDAFREEIRRSLRARGIKPGDDGFEAVVERIYRESSPDISVRVRMINVNYGHSRKILSACKPLEEYAWFVARIRGYVSGIDGKGDGKEGDDGNGKSGGMEIGAAIDRAIDDMPEGFLIRDFLLANKAEVKDMCLTEYNEEETMEMFWEEGREEGRKKGREEGQGEKRLMNIRSLMETLHFSAQEAMDALRIPAEMRGLYLEKI